MTDNTSNKTVGKFILNERLYLVLKQFAQLVFPAAITLYATLGTAWGWPAQDQMLATLGAINVFLGVVLGVSTSSYNNAQSAGALYDGTIVVGESSEVIENPQTGEVESNKVPKSFSIDLSGNDISKRKEIRIKVEEEPAAES